MSQMFAPAQAVDDVDLARRVAGYLAGQGFLADSLLKIEARRGVVTVGGKVGTKQLKWLASQCCRRVAGVVQLIDAIEVDGPTGAPLANPRSCWQGPGPLDNVLERNHHHERQTNSSRGSPHSRRGL